MRSINTLFSPEGPLAKAISGFKPRQAQLDMAEAIERAMQDKATLVVEAGTGTGKTFAYLLPALKGKQKVIVSTGTKNLQEQLFHRDLPLVKKALGSHKKTALLKGRANYLCMHRLKQHQQGSTLLDKAVLNEFSLVKRWAVTTKTGDVAELTSVRENAAVLPLVTSTVDNCLGKDCPDYEDCYLVKARKKAMDADLLVVNHHLFFADLALKDTGFGELIPEAELIIFDEAHQIPDIASEYFGEAFSSRQLTDLCKDIERIYRTTVKDAQQLYRAAEKLKLTLHDLRLSFPHEPEKGKLSDALNNPELASQLNTLSEVLGLLYDVCKAQLGRDKDLDAVFERISESRTRLAAVTDTSQSGVSLWYETTPRHLVLHLTPLSIANKFARIVSEPPRSWVFTSATLKVGEDFGHFTRQMGLEEARTLALDSPFDYPNQAMLCVPQHLHEPYMREQKALLLDVAKQVVKASEGRCFLLFTSHAMLQDMAAKLADQIDNPILVQGTTSKRELLDQFVQKPDAVLLGTGAFWEGVDVKGKALTAVMIDKLPFASPDDPLLQARVEDCRKRGYNPFNQIQIPQAVIALKQGAGRLIRDHQDQGVLIICDHRLVSKEYGKVFLQSLPDMRRTRRLPEALAFLAQINTTQEQE